MKRFVCLKNERKTPQRLAEVLGNSQENDYCKTWRDRYPGTTEKRISSTSIRASWVTSSHSSGLPLATIEIKLNRPRSGELCARVMVEAVMVVVNTCQTTAAVTGCNLDTIINHSCGICGGCRKLKSSELKSKSNSGTLSLIAFHKTSQ